MAKVKLDKGAVFERREKKYILSREQKQAVLAALHGHIHMDAYGKHTICTLYYDTDNFDIIRRCLDKPKFREKLRLRSYGVPRPDSTVFLELKKKYNGVTYKRRVALPLKEATQYMQNGSLPTETGQIFSEIDWFTKQRPLSAKALLCYDRVAYYDDTDPDLRITFDANIRWRDYNLSLDKGDHGALLLPGSYLMEVKTMGALPLWLVDILSQNGIYPTSYSKYGTIYREHLCSKEGIRHAV